MKAIAIFDIDGTVLPEGSAERYLLRYLSARGEVGIHNAVSFVGRFLLTLPTSWLMATKGNKFYLRGKSQRRIEQLAEACFYEEIAPRISRLARQKIEEHRDSGLEIVLLSGTLDVLLRHFQTHLRADHAHGATLEAAGGRYTGRISGVYPYGASKAKVVRTCYGSGSYDLSASYAYADHLSDLEFLELLGHPAVVNASSRLIRNAKRKGIGAVLF